MDLYLPVDNSLIKFQVPQCNKIGCMQFPSERSNLPIAIYNVTQQRQNWPFICIQ